MAFRALGSNDAEVTVLARPRTTKIVEILGRCMTEASEADGVKSIFGWFVYAFEK